LAFAPVQTTLGASLGQRLRHKRDIEPSTSSALFLTLLEVLAMEGWVPHLQQHRELHMDAAVPGVPGRAEEFVSALCLQPNQRCPRSTTERTFQLPLRSRWRTSHHWFSNAISKQFKAISSINKRFHINDSSPSNCSIILNALQYHLDRQCLTQCSDIGIIALLRFENNRDTIDIQDA